MRRYQVVAAAVVLAMLACNRTFAAPNLGHRPTRVPIGTNPHPVIWGGMKAKPATASPSRPSHHHAGRSRPFHHGRGPFRSRFFGGYVPAYRYFYYGFGVPYYYDFGPYGYPYYPPYYAAFPQPLPRLDPPPAAAEPEPPKENLRATNARSRELAWRFIGFGDAQFARGEFAEANNRYRKAAQTGPQVADTWFRQGFAMTAIGRYDLAMRSIIRGLAIDPNWASSRFDLEELFAHDAVAKQSHLDALVQAAAAEPLNADLLFLVGVHLHFDGQQDLSQDYFQRAERIAGDNASHLWKFLKKPEEEL